MKNILAFLFVFGGAVSSYGQDTAPAAPVSTKIHLVRSGLMYFHEKYENYNPLGSTNKAQGVGILLPAYTGIWDHLYLSAAIPNFSYQKLPYQSFRTMGWEPSAGYAFCKSGSRIRPFAALALGMSFTKNIQEGYQDPYSTYPGSSQQTFQLAFNLRVGTYVQVSKRIWLDLTIQSPTGHQLYVNQRFKSVNGGDHYRSFHSEAFDNSFHTYLPHSQLGVSYQIH